MRESTDVLPGGKARTGSWVAPKWMEASHRVLNRGINLSIALEAIADVDVAVPVAVAVAVAAAVTSDDAVVALPPAHFIQGPARYVAGGATRTQN